MGNVFVDEELERAAICTLINRMIDAWNQRNLNGFVSGYLDAGDFVEATFVSERGLISGYQRIFDYFRRKFDDENQDTGKLCLVDDKIYVFSPTHAAAYLRWRLTNEEGQRTGGSSTLIFAKVREEWKIIHDHSS